MNQFDNLDAQNEISSFAQMSPEEHSEMQNWLDQINIKFDEEELQPIEIVQKS